MSALGSELEALGGTAAPPAATARLRKLLGESLRHGDSELAKSRSGYGAPVEVAIAGGDGRLVAALPAPAALRADAETAGERAWLLVAATIGTLVELADAPAPAGAGDLRLEAGTTADGHLALGFPARADPADLGLLVPLAFDEHAGRIDRLRARALAVPAAVLGDVAPSLRAPLEPAHPLRIAEAVARLGGRPAEADSVEGLEEAVLALLGPGHMDGHRPHEDPDPGRRTARRILQRLDGMGKWGGYHTEFAHLSRGFAGNEKALAQAVGEALLASGLLSEKPSVGQRHVFLNPRRAADIHRLIESGETPRDLRLP